MKEFPAEGEWSFYDKHKTSAEIIKNFYQTIKEGAGDAVIIGCNAIGHLCAGIHHFNRTGDDTSGYDWSRTRKMGVNTLAFRLVQNNIFFGADADCVGITGAIDWKYNKQWLKLLAFSGSCLFVSCKPGILNEEETTDLKEGFMAGARQADTLIPLDWMESATPQRYLLNGEEFSVELF
jgi:alpha-galactosidase